MNRKHQKVFYGWWVVGACLLINLYTGGVVFFGFTAIFKPLVKEFGWSYAQISLAASLRGLESGLLAPFVGLFADRLGTRKLMVGGSILVGLGLIFLSRTTSLGMFYGAFVLITMGMSASTATVVMTAVVQWFRKKLTLATGIVASGFALGGLLVPLIAMLIDTLGWRMTMLSFGLGTFVIVLPLSLLVLDKPEQYGYLPDGEVKDTEVIDERLTLAQSSEVSTGAMQALKSSTFWHITLAFLCQFTILGAVVTHVMPYLSSVGIARSTSSLVASAIPLASIVGRLGFGWLGRFDKRQVTAVGFAMMGLSLLFFGYASTRLMWLLVPFIILFGIGWGGNVITRVALLREHFGRARFGTIHGFVIGVVALGHVIGASLPGWVYDKWGSYQGVWLAFAGLAVAAVVTILTTPRLNDTIQHNKQKA